MKKSRKDVKNKRGKGTTVRMMGGAGGARDGDRRRDAGRGSEAHQRGPFVHTRPGRLRSLPKAYHRYRSGHTQYKFKYINLGDKIY